MPTEASVIAGSARPVTRARIVADLRALGVDDGDVLLVHIAMSSLGWVIGGAQTVVAALLDAVGSGGTLVMPAQSANLSDPSTWGNPPVPAEWFDEIRREMPAFDPALTPTWGIGAVAECFRDHPETRRSPHPLSSFAANGPLAAAIVAEHPLAPAFGDSSPLARLYELDACVLLIGVDHDRNTSLHLAEHRAEWPGKRFVQNGAPMRRHGKRRWVPFEDLSWDGDDFAQIGAAFQATGAETAGRIAQADGRLMSQRRVVDFGVAWMTANRTG